MEELDKTIEFLKTKIIYCDQELKVTSISGVSEDQLEDCLKTIVESNPNTSFSVIQYSKRSRRLYLFADGYINIKDWQSKTRPRNNSPFLNTTTDVLEEIKKILLDEKKQEKSCISIYDSDTVIPLYEVVKLIRQTEKDYQKMSDNYEERIRNSYRQRQGDYAHLYLRDFDFNANELKIGFGHYSFSNYTYCCFEKKDDDLKGRRESGYYDLDELLLSAGKIISEAYDKFMEYKDYKTQSKCNVRPVNAKFLVDIDKYGVEINTKSNILSLHYRSYSDEPKYGCDSHNIIEILKDKEDELAKRILIRIDDCPEWMHGILYEKRTKMLKEKKTKEEIERQLALKQSQHQQKVASKKQKRIEFRKKILPFFDKKDN